MSLSATTGAPANSPSQGPLPLPSGAERGRLRGHSEGAADEAAARAGRIAGYDGRLDLALEALLTEPMQTSPALHRAMRYAVEGGKRLRAAVVFAIGDALGGRAVVLDRVAASAEFVHAAARIVEDLPGLGDVPRRYGKAACHVVFGEAATQRASQALTFLAFETISTRLPGSTVARMVNILSGAGSSRALVGAETRLLDLVDRGVSCEALDHYRRGAAMDACCVELAMLGAGVCEPSIQSRVRAWASDFFVARRIYDELLELRCTRAAGAEIDESEAGRSRIVDMLGVRGARQLAQEIFERSCMILQGAPADLTPLLDVAVHHVSFDAVA